jgi:hypothetical protein
MLSPKWSIFRVINYLQLIQALVILGILIYEYISLMRGISLGFYSLLCSVFIVMIINNCMNAHIMHSYFPAKSLPGGKRRFYMVVFILYIIVNMGLLALTIFGLTEEITAERNTYKDRDNTGWIIVSILSFDVLMSIFIIIIQSGLPGFLNRNNQQQMQQLVDEIGRPG